MEQKGYRLTKALVLDIQHPYGVYTKYLLNNRDALRWQRALNSIESMMRGVFVIGQRYEIVIEQEVE